MEKRKWATEEVVEILLMATDKPEISYYIPDDVIFWIIDKLKERDEYETVLGYYREEEYMKERKERADWGIYG